MVLSLPFWAIRGLVAVTTCKDSQWFNFFLSNSLGGILGGVSSCVYLPSSNRGLRKNMMKQSKCQVLKRTEEKGGYGANESQKLVCDFLLVTFWGLFLSYEFF